MTDRFLPSLPAANACPANFGMLGKLLAIPAFGLPVFPEKSPSASVEKQGVVIQKVFDRDGVEVSQLVRNLWGEASAEIAAFKVLVEPFFHADHGGNVFLKQKKVIPFRSPEKPF